MSFSRLDRLENAAAELKYQMVAADYETADVLLRNIAGSGVAKLPGVTKAEADAYRARRAKGQEFTADDDEVDAFNAVARFVHATIKSDYGPKSGLWWNWNPNYPEHGARFEVGSITSNFIAGAQLSICYQRGSVMFDLETVRPYVEQPLRVSETGLVEAVSADEMEELVEKKFQHVCAAFVGLTHEDRKKFKEDHPGEEIRFQWDWDSSQKRRPFSCTFKKYAARNAAPTRRFGT